MLPLFTNSFIIISIKHGFKHVNKRNFYNFNCLTSKNKCGSDKCKQTDENKVSIRYNLHPECEDGLNRQINKELYASYVYSSMAVYFDRYNVALKGFAKLFRLAADEEILHGRLFMQYLTMRGGNMVLYPITAPERNNWDTPLCAVHSSIELEKSVMKSLESLHEQATKYKDISLCDLIEAQYMTEQHKALKMLGDLHTNVTRAGSGSGLLILDHDLREYLKSKDDWKMYDIKEL